LRQRESLNRFVVSAETTGEKDHGIGFLHEDQLAGEEKVKSDKLGVVADD